MSAVYRDDKIVIITIIIYFFFFFLLLIFDRGIRRHRRNGKCNGEPVRGPRRVIDIDIARARVHGSPSERFFLNGSRVWAHVVKPVGRELRFANPGGDGFWKKKYIFFFMFIIKRIRNFNANEWKHNIYNRQFSLKIFFIFASSCPLRIANNSAFVTE